MSESAPTRKNRLPTWGIYLGVAVFLGGVLAWYEMQTGKLSQECQYWEDYIKDWMNQIPEDDDAATRINWYIRTKVPDLTAEQREIVAESAQRTGGMTLDGVSYKFDKDGYPIKLTGPADPRFPDLNNEGRIPGVPSDLQTKADPIEKSAPENTQKAEATPVVERQKVENITQPVEVDADAAERNIDQIASKTENGTATSEQVSSLQAFLAAKGTRVSESEAREIFTRGWYERDGRMYTLWKSDFRDSATSFDATVTNADGTTSVRRVHLAAFFETPQA